MGLFPYLALIISPLPGLFQQGGSSAGGEACEWEKLTDRGGDLVDTNL